MIFNLAKMQVISSSVALAVAITLGGCAGGGTVQPDRAIFMIDNNYQSYNSSVPIEQAFDQTVRVFRDAGYKLDVVDRATGQISGRRGASGDKGVQSDKDLKVYVLILPSNGRSTLRIKIVQVISSGPLGTSKAEIIVNDPDLYKYLFERIETAGASSAMDASDYDPKSKKELPSTLP